MKKVYLIAAFAAFQLAAAQKTIALKEIQKLGVSGDINLNIVKGTENKLVINSDEEDLVVEQRAENRLGLSGEGNATLYYTGGLSAIAATDDAIITASDEIKAANFSIAATSDAQITLKVDVDWLNTAATSDAKITLTGRAKEHKAALESDAILTATGLETEVTNIVATLDAQAAVKASKSVKAVASNDAVITVHGEPKEIKETKTNDGVIKRAK